MRQSIGLLTCSWCCLFQTWERILLLNLRGIGNGINTKQPQNGLKIHQTEIGAKKREIQFIKKIKMNSCLLFINPNLWRPSGFWTISVCKQDLYPPIPQQLRVVMNPNILNRMDNSYSVTLLKMWNRVYWYPQQYGMASITNHWRPLYLDPNTKRNPKTSLYLCVCFHSILQGQLQMLHSYLHHGESRNVPISQCFHTC